MSTLDLTLKPEATTLRRLEVITGTGRRRQFSEDFKAGIVEETLVPGAIVSDVARRNGLTPQQVFTWRRQARRPVASEATDLTEAYHEVGAIVARIRKGEAPGNIPVQQPTKFQMVVNTKTAKTLGMNVPESILIRADEVIE